MAQQPPQGQQNGFLQVQNSIFRKVLLPRQLSNLPAAVAVYQAKADPPKQEQPEGTYALQTDDRQVDLPDHLLAQLDNFSNAHQEEHAENSAATDTSSQDQSNRDIIDDAAPASSNTTASHSLHQISWPDPGMQLQQIDKPHSEAMALPAIPDRTPTQRHIDSSKAGASKHDAASSMSRDHVAARAQSISDMPSFAGLEPLLPHETKRQEELLHQGWETKVVCENDCKFQVDA